MRNLAGPGVQQQVAGFEEWRQATIAASHGRLTQRIASLRPKRRRFRRVLRTLRRLVTG